MRARRPLASYPHHKHRFHFLRRRNLLSNRSKFLRMRRRRCQAATPHRRWFCESSREGILGGRNSAPKATFSIGCLDLLIVWANRQTNFGLRNDCERDTWNLRRITHHLVWLNKKEWWLIVRSGTLIGCGSGKSNHCHHCNWQRVVITRVRERIYTSRYMQLVFQSSSHWNFHIQSF